MFLSKWFMSLFTILPWPCVLRVFDLFLLEGRSALFRVAVALLETFESDVMGAPSIDTLLPFLLCPPNERIIPDVFLSKVLQIPIEKLLEAAADFVLHPPRPSAKRSLFDRFIDTFTPKKNAPQKSKSSIKKRRKISKVEAPCTAVKPRKTSEKPSALHTPKYGDLPAFDPMAGLPVHSGLSPVQAEVFRPKRLSIYLEKEDNSKKKEVRKSDDHQNTLSRRRRKATANKTLKKRLSALKETKLDKKSQDRTEKPSISLFTKQDNVSSFFQPPEEEKCTSDFVFSLENPLETKETAVDEDKGSEDKENASPSKSNEFVAKSSPTKVLMVSPTGSKQMMSHKRDVSLSIRKRAILSPYKTATMQERSPLRTLVRGDTSSSFEYIHTPPNRADLFLSPVADPISPKEDDLRSEYKDSPAMKSFRTPTKVTHLVLSTCNTNFFHPSFLFRSNKEGPHSTRLTLSLLGGSF